MRLKRFFFFAIMFGFSASNPLWCLQANIIEIFFLIVEEVDFFYFHFILEVEALSMSRTRSLPLLTSRCILLDSDLTMLSH